MFTNNSSTSLVFGLATFSLALIIAGVGMYRRRSRSIPDSTQGEMETKAGNGDEEKPLEAVVPVDQESHNHADSKASRTHLPLDYFVLVFALTIPLWLFGGDPLPIPIKLPVSALSLVIPLIAACILTYRRDGFTGIKELFKRAFEYRKIKNKVWYLPILFLPALISVLSYAVMRLAGLPLPDPQIPWLIAPIIFLAFFFAGIGEELGWMGYAFDPMQDRWGALKASILLGLVWAVYHLIPDLQNKQTADWILWHRLGTVALRILIAWIYNNTGRSVFAVILFHAMINLGWALFPNYGSHYDPFVTFMITLPAVVIVILGWEPKTLTRFRHAGL